MNPKNARIARIYTTQKGGRVADTTPNAPDVAGEMPGTSFDLVVEIEAGPETMTKAPYTLAVSAIDDSTGGGASTLEPDIPPQSFSTPPFRCVGPDFVLVQNFNIPVPATGVRGHLFHYTAVLHNANFQIVSMQSSERFLLV
ncbi:hypothetical protein [Spongiactinospora sp. TRM90649]|uniref:hypothetical protein n=1 Tax=Spongiactinospora sp. TRM90649 TaxID=3031114 RepID=UPI0023F6C6C8|nr:hypothetical protein [Spongiactinospora sp. TRM90649]MDF5756967.1 hypothetical protein [Spongiactinospora sp. TRM90649]